MKVVYLEWQDAFSNSRWHEESEIKQLEDFIYLVRQTGFLLRETKRYIIFAGSWHPHKGTEEDQYGDLHKIPKTWILCRKTLYEVK